MIYSLQKANILRRFSAFLLDFILVVIVATGAILLMSKIVNYDKTSNELDTVYLEYKEKYGFDFREITETKYNEFTEEQKETYDNAYKELVNDEDFKKTYALIINKTFLMVTIGVLLGILLIEFIVPLFLKNGQTPGKKCFQIAVMMENGVKITTFALLTRTLLGKFLETMVPIYILIMLLFGNVQLIHLFILAAVVLVELCLLIFNYRHALIHDLISYTVVVDKQTQMIFESEDELMKYKNEQNEKAARNKKTF